MSSLANLSVVARALAAPIRRWPPIARLAAALLSIICCLYLAMDSVSRSESVFIAGDARFYLGIATGDYSQVMQPFASRQLGALVVAALAHGMHWTVERAFMEQGLLSLIVMLVAIYYIALHTKAPRWLLPAIAVTAFWGPFLENLVLPDLWYSALLVLVLLMLAGEHMLGASLMMFPLMLSRESTSLTLICFLIAGWGWMQWRDRIVAVVSAIAGSILVSHLAARAQPNFEHLPTSIYMLAKVPWNFMRNVLGVVPWSNVNTQFCAVPVWTTQVPLGRLHAIGICGFSPDGWVEMLRSLLNDFGLLPLLVVALWWRCRKLAIKNVLLRFTLLYGGISLLLAPILGTWFERLFGYAWPLFFVALPLLFDQCEETSPKGSRALAAIGLFAAHLAIFIACYRWMGTERITLDAALWIAGFFLLRHWLGEGYKPLAEAPLLES